MSTSLQTVEPEALPLSSQSLPLSADKKASFFNALISTGGHLGKACQLAQISRQRVLVWRQTDSVFAAAYDEAVEFGTENLEESLYQRGMAQDTTAAIFLLKSRRPEKYRENIRVESEVNLSDESVNKLGEALIANLLLAAQQRQQAIESQGVIDIKAETPACGVPRAETETLAKVEG